MRKLGKLKILAYFFIVLLLALSIYFIIVGAMIYKAGFRGLGYSVASASLSIPIAIENAISGTIGAFGQMIEHYLNTLN